MLKAVGISQLACLMMTRWVHWGVGSLAVVMAEVICLLPLPAVRVPSRAAVTGRVAVGASSKIGPS